MTVHVYPLRFEPSLHPKVWGGRQLQARLGKALPTNQPYGESWEIFWQNRIANGEYRGKTLGELIAVYPVEMVGSKDADPEFPLLIKFIDAQDWLSVQVHPDDKLAAELEGQPRGKTECWYIVDAVPGAQIVYGFAQQIDADGFRKVLESGHGKDVLQFVNVSPGDFVSVPAGTMHAIGPGILLYELQQTSDTTYRVYDWDRPGLDGKPRELHVEKSMRAADFEVKPRAVIPYQEKMVDQVSSVATLIVNDYFSLTRLWFQTRDLLNRFIFMAIEPLPVASAVTVIKGNATLAPFDNAGNEKSSMFESVSLRLGDSAFIPANLRYVVNTSEETQLLVAVPENL